MTNEYQSEFRARLRQQIITYLAREAINGASWKEALEGFTALFASGEMNVSQSEIEREIATLIELRAMGDDIAKATQLGAIDLDKARAERFARPPEERVRKEREREIKEAQPGGGSRRGFEKVGYGAGVRAQVFEVVVRQGVIGAPWRAICAGPMLVNNIDPEDVQIEIDRRRAMLNLPPLRPLSGNDTENGDDDSPRSGGGGGGSPKTPVPKNPLPSQGGAARKLSEPGKARGKDATASEVKGKDFKGRDESSKSKSKVEQREEADD